MTLQEIKNQMKEKDQSLIDVLFTICNDFNKREKDELQEISNYCAEIQAKYGDELLSQFFESEEYNNIFKTDEDEIDEEKMD